MRLKDDEKAMLDGARGPAPQKAMEFLVRYGQALGAEEMVDVASVGGAWFLHGKRQLEGGGMDALLSQYYLDSDTPCKLCGVCVPTANFETGMDPDYYELIGKTKDDVDAYQFSEEYLQKLGIQLHCTCTPYQVGFVPVKGQHCVWMESSAVAYINGVLGARTNCEGSESSTASMLTGKTPNWGYHLTENRYGTHLIETNIPVLTNKEWGLLGYFAGKIVQQDIPVISGISSLPDRDMLKHFGAAAASSGGVEMYHIPGITAEANSVSEAFGPKKPKVTLEYGREQKKYAYDLLNAIGSNTNVDFVMLGCPHYSLEQVWTLCEMLRDKHINSGVNLWVFMPKALRDTAVRNGYVKIIEDAGGVVLRDCCPALGQFKPKGSTVMATDSAKQAHYLPNFTGIESWYGSTEECVRAAISGRWDGELNG